MLVLRTLSAISKPTVLPVLASGVPLKSCSPVAVVKLERYLATAAQPNTDTEGKSENDQKRVEEKLKVK
jgi:hypothetical protein